MHINYLCSCCAHLGLQCSLCMRTALLLQLLQRFRRKIITHTLKHKHTHTHTMKTVTPKKTTYNQTGEYRRGGGSVKGQQSLMCECPRCDLLRSSSLPFPELPTTLASGRVSLSPDWWRAPQGGSMKLIEAWCVWACACACACVLVCVLSVCLSHTSNQPTRTRVA